MRIDDRPGACHKLMMQGLEPRRLVHPDLGNRSVLPFYAAGGKHGSQIHGSGIDFIKGNPVAHLVLIAVEDGSAVSLIQANQLPRSPAVIFLHQRIRQLIVADCYQRLDAMRPAAVKHAVIKGQPGLVRLLFHAGRINSGPVDTGPEYPKAHLRQKGDVLLIMMIEINRFMAGIKAVRMNMIGNPFRRGMAAVGAHIRHARSLAVDIPRTLKLVCCTGAAPQEIFRKSSALHFRLLSFHSQ